jgi:hypothetical protein
VPPDSYYYHLCSACRVYTPRAVLAAVLSALGETAFL